MSKTLYWTGILALCTAAGCSQLPLPGGAPRSVAPVGPPLLETSATAAGPASPPVVPRRARPPAGPVRWRADRPQNYVVKPDDTLLQVAGVFLEQPWRWQEVWRPAAGTAATQLYPGQIIELVDEPGQPHLRPATASAADTVRLSPQARVEALSQPIATLPRAAVAGFLKESIVVDSSDWEAAPVIVSNYDDRVLLPAGWVYIYVTGLDSSDQRRYRVFHPLGEYRDPGSGQSLGFGGAFVGTAVLEKAEEEQPAVLVMTDSQMEARAGDRLFPADQFTAVEPYNFTLQAPPPDLQGQIISLLGNNVVAGQYQSVVVNLGAGNGVTVGDMLGVYSTGRGLRNCAGYAGRLPAHNIATLMLYKVYDQVSYGLITAMRDYVERCDGVGEP